MKKYHIMKIYQVSPQVGYLKRGAEFSPITVLGATECKYKLEAAITVIDTEQIIIVERISPSLVKEVKTGIIFPIVNFKSNGSSSKELKRISCIYGRVHTFVCSEDNKLVSDEVTTYETLQDYNRMYPDNEKLKEVLKTIITTGKANMEAVIVRQKENSKKQERIHYRKLQRQFKQERKNILK